MISWSSKTSSWSSSIISLVEIVWIICVWWIWIDLLWLLVPCLWLWEQPCAKKPLPKLWRCIGLKYFLQWIAIFSATNCICTNWTKITVRTLCCCWILYWCWTRECCRSIRSGGKSKPWFSIAFVHAINFPNVTCTEWIALTHTVDVYVSSLISIQKLENVYRMNFSFVFKYMSMCQYKVATKRILNLVLRAKLNKSQNHFFKFNACI